MLRGGRRASVDGQGKGKSPIGNERRVLGKGGGGNSPIGTLGGKVVALKPIKRGVIIFGQGKKRGRSRAACRLHQEKEKRFFREKSGNETPSDAKVGW